MFHTIDIIDKILDKMLLIDENGVKTYKIYMLNPTEKAILTNYAKDDADIIELYGYYHKLLKTRRKFIHLRDKENTEITTKHIETIEDELIHKFNFNGYSDYMRLTEMYGNKIK